MATYRAGCSSVGGYSYAGNFSLYVELNDTNTNIGNNTSQVQYNVYCRSSGSGSISSNHTIYFELNGQVIVNQTKNVSASSPNANIPIASGSLTVSHNSDGTKTVNFGALIQAQSYGVSANMSNTFNLNTIPRASSLTCTTANVEETAIITITSASSGFRHNVRYGFGTLSGTALSNVAGGSHSWVLPSSFYAQFPTQKTTQGTLWCDTYSGGTKIGESAYIFTVTTSESRCKPTLTASVKDTNATTKALTGNESRLIKYKSTAQVTINASAKNSASIFSKKVNNQNVSGTTISYSNVEATSFAVTVTDSRGYSNSTTLKPTIINYVPLSINASFFRPQPTTGQISLSFSGNYFNGSFGATNNTLSIQWQWKESTSSTWQTGGTITATISGNTFKSNGNISLGSSYNYQKAYNFKLIVKDKLVTLQPTYTVSVGKPIADWGKDFFDINGNFNVTGKAVLENGIKSKDAGNVGTPVGNGMLVIKRANNSEAPNNGVVLEYGNYTSWVGQLYIGDNSYQGIYYNGWSDGVRGSWRRLADEAIKLFDAPSGTQGTIQLSETSANFSYLEFFYGDGSNFMSQKIQNPNGKAVMCPFTNFTNNRVNLLYIQLKISGTSVTRGQGYSFNYEGQSTNNDIKVFKILGYK